MLQRTRFVAVAALVVASTAGCWAMPGQGPRRQGYNPFETAITVDNVDTLAPVWTTVVGAEDPGDDGQVRPAPAGPPVVASNGRVLVSTRDSLQSLNATTGARQTLWSDWTVAQPHDLELFTTGDGRLGTGARTGTFQQATAWYDAATGAPTSGPHVGSIGSLRKPWIAGTSDFTDFNQGPTPVPVRFLHVRRLDDPGAGWQGRLGNGVGASGVALTPTAVIQAGQGLTTGVPGDGTVRNGVRSFALEGTAVDCGAGATADHACPEWYTPVDGTAAGPVVLSDDDATAYFTTDAGTLYAVATADGTIRWSIAGAGPLATPALADGVLLVPLAAGAVGAYDADGCGAPTCTPLWTTAPAGDEITQQPSVAGGVVFTSDADGTLAAYDLAGCGEATCDPLWVEELGAGITGAPAISLGHLYAGLEDGRVVAFAPQPAP
ncbi:MAG TPA: PQQ-binding-like beta-propeller repeat protein [Acidimicrobiales bacterium]